MFTPQAPPPLADDAPPKPGKLARLVRGLDKTVLYRLLGHFRPHARAAVLGALMTLAASALSLRLYWMVRDVFQPIIEQGGTLAQLTRVTLMVLLVAFGRSFAMWGQIYFTNLAGQRVIADLRDRVYEQLMRLSVGYFDRARTGQLMSRLTNDMNTLQLSLVNAIIELFTAPLMILGGIASMFFLSWRLMLLATVCVPAIVFLIRGAGARMNRASLWALEKLGDLSETMQERLSAIRIVHTFGTELTEVQHFAERNAEALRARMREVRVQAMLTPSIELMAAFGLSFALWFGGREALSGRMAPQDILAFVVFVQSTYSQFKRLGAVMLVLQQISAAATRIYNILDEPPSITDAPEAIELPRLEGAVEFKEVSFRYNSTEPVLENISFRTAPGEVVALVGASGSGKTTIASLVPRLYDVTEGSVAVDGHDVRSVTLLSLRRQLGVVPQETLLFSGTIRDNILYGRPDATPEQVYEAARQANAAEFIEGLEHGYDTVVGERGAMLSGGQRQRLAIARALLRDPRILILDEATSSLDTQSESLVQQALEVLMRNRTTLVIAHRLSTIRNADRILVLHAGRIVEQGTHDELMTRQGHYARLYEMQAGQRQDSASASPPAEAPLTEPTPAAV